MSNEHEPCKKETRDPAKMPEALLSAAANLRVVKSDQMVSVKIAIRD